ncbi:lysosomal acid glucosylceramidase-like [Bicyclus anynana]|uniref:Glucosylceramidase n=1 Tax=Bicyclus anynana TaxID=110368 RepID=A0ABM3LIC6_BICAN|nr:lysosomal acid glucosylceramidase-like [Bicyclus anynana]
MNHAYDRLTLRLNASERYQTIVGFGGGISDSAAINWKDLSPELQDYFIQSYFGENGLEYNMLRTPIGGTDYSTRFYSYNDLPKNDAALTNFTFTEEDIKYKIPMFKASMAMSKTPIYVIGSTWSPPLWMKTNESIIGFTQLKFEYYQTYADFHLKFIELYSSAGIPIWAITTTNEPLNGVLELSAYNTLGWSLKNLGEWIFQNLGPTIRNSKFKDVKIITSDDQRLTIPYFVYMLLVLTPQAIDYIDGFGVHFYSDQVVPPSVYESININYEYGDKFIIATEACEGSFPWETIKVAYGSWERAFSYTLGIIQDLNYNFVGWMDWNLCLDTQGGPNWAGNYVDAAIIVDKSKQEFIKQPMFYAMGHFSKFIPRGSMRIQANETSYCPPSSNLYKTAFITPKNTIVVNLYNDDRARTINLQIENQQATVHLEADSITTVEFLQTQNCNLNKKN